MFEMMGKIVFLIIALYCGAAWGYEQQILQESNLDNFVLLLEQNDLEKQDVYLIISRLNYLGESNPEAFVLLGDLYKQNKLHCSGMNILPESERLMRAKEAYQKAASYSIAANLKLAEMYSSNKERYLKYILKAAVLGDSQARNIIKENLIAGWYFSHETLNEQARNLCGIKLSDTHTTDDKKTISSTVSPSKENAVVSSDKSADNAIDSITPTANVQPPKAFSSEISDGTALLPHISFEQSFVIRFIILGIVGLIFASKKTVYLFYNTTDAVITSIASLFLLGIFINIFNGNSENYDSLTLYILIVAILLVLFLLSIPTNPQMWWSFLIVVPAKSIIGVLGIIAALGSVGNALEAVKSKKNRGVSILTAALFGALAYGIYKVIKNTTKNK